MVSHYYCTLKSTRKGTRLAVCSTQGHLCRMLKSTRISWKWRLTIMIMSISTWPKSHGGWYDHEYSWLYQPPGFMLSVTWSQARRGRLDYVCNMQANIETRAQTHTHTYEWMNERTNEWTNERTNQRMNFTTYIPPVKLEGQAQGCILRRFMVINPLSNDSPVRM